MWGVRGCGREDVRGAYANSGWARAAGVRDPYDRFASLGKLCDLWPVRLSVLLDVQKSTANCPGVYNSPYVEPIRAFGTPMEQHLQNNFKKVINNSNQSAACKTPPGCGCLYMLYCWGFDYLLAYPLTDCWQSKYCHRHMRRALGSVQYQRTYQRFGQTTGTVGQGVNTGGSSYQYASMPRPVDAYKLQPLHEENWLAQMVQQNDSHVLVKHV